MDKLILILGAVIVSILALVLVSFLLSWPVYMLWNGCLVDAVTGLKEVTWMQAWGINILTGFLFKTTVSKKD